MGEGGSQGGKPCLPASFQISDHAAAFWLQGMLLEILSVALESISNLATIQFGSGFSAYQQDALAQVAVSDIFFEVPFCSYRGTYSRILWVS